VYCGQALIVAESIADRFERVFAEKWPALKVGIPFDEKDGAGATVNADGLADLDRDVKKTVEAGAKVLTGGKRLDRPGNFYAPTVLTNIRRAHRHTRKSYSVRWRACSGLKTRMTRFESRTTAGLDWGERLDERQE